MNNIYVLTFVFWPCVVVLCAAINMFVSRATSWEEVVFDYFVGCAAGVFLYLGTRNDPSAAGQFFFIFSHGLLAVFWLYWESFREALRDPIHFFWFMAGLRVGATLWAAALDHIAVMLGARLDWGPFFFSFLLAPVKMLFSLVTSAAGLLIWLAGLAWAICGRGNAGFAGGVLYSEFNPDDRSMEFTTTIGFTMAAWLSPVSFKHELYHSRQYIYMSDWMMPAWTVGLLWAIVSALLQGEDLDFEQIVGPLNPLEVAAYKLG